LALIAAAAIAGVGAGADADRRVPWTTSQFAGSAA